MIAALCVLQALGYVLIGVGFWMLLRLAGEVQDIRQERNRIEVGGGFVKVHGEPLTQDQADLIKRAFLAKQRDDVPDDYSWTNRKAK